MTKKPGRRRGGSAGVGVALLVGAAIGLAAASAEAQSPPAPEQPPGLPKNANPPSESTTPPPDPESGPGRADQPPLSKELKENDGVLEAPRALDNGIVREPPVPEPGTTPVIPPPGSPGGHPDVEPK